jgi:hypothetical protein
MVGQNQFHHPAYIFHLFNRKAHEEGAKAAALRCKVFTT